MSEQAEINNCDNCVFHSISLQERPCSKCNDDDDLWMGAKDVIALQSSLTTAQEENKRYMDALCDFENKNKDITSRCAKNVIRIEVLERALEKYEAAIKEAEAILGGEYAMQYGPFFDLVQDAQSALNGGKNG